MNYSLGYCMLQAQHSQSADKEMGNITKQHSIGLTALKHLLEVRHTFSAKVESVIYQTASKKIETSFLADTSSLLQIGQDVAPVQVG